MRDFLTSDDRSLTLADFPYFFDEEVELVYTGDPELGPDAFDEIIAWQSAFRDTGRALSLESEASNSSGTLFVGLYNQADDVVALLATEAITLEIDPPIVEKVNQAGNHQGDDDALEDSEDDSNNEEEDATSVDEEEVRTIHTPLGAVQMSGTALILLTEELGQPKMILLASSAEGLENSTQRLVDLMPVGAESSLDDCLLQGKLALCPTGVADEEGEARLSTSGQPDFAAEEDEESEEPVEDEVDTEEPSDEGDEEEAGISIIPDADLQGTIGLDETIEATLEAEQAHAWLFSSGPALVNITLQPSEPIDGILELFDPDGTLMGSSDSDFTAGEERMEYVEIPDDQDYTIVVRNFYEDGGDYTLSVESVRPADIGAADQGTLESGVTGEGTLEEGVVHSWSFEIEAPTIATITMTPDPELDGLIMLFDPNDNYLVSVDDGFSGEEEQIDSLELVEPGQYTVIVAGYTFGGGSYLILLELAP